MITFLLKVAIEDYCLFKPYQMSRNVKNQGLNYPTQHITIILRLETNSYVYFSIATCKYYFNRVEVVVIGLNKLTKYHIV